MSARARLRAYLAVAAAGFRRHSTYRQATVAACVTNSIFGFLRAAVMLAVLAAGGSVVAGYDAPKLMTFVWAGQGLIGTVLIWAPPDLAGRIRTGDVVIDLLRPVDLVWQQLASDLGRAAFALGVRFAVPVAVGALCFDLYAPERLLTYPLFACSLLFATIVCFACRFLVNAAAYWLLDARGPQMAWTLTSGILGGLYFPLWFLPSPVSLALVAGLPFASTIQIPLDVLVERGGTAAQLALLGVQGGWVVVTLALCRVVQARGERKLVVQGG